jgi:hypothetical protein
MLNLSVAASLRAGYEEFGSRRGATNHSSLRDRMLFRPLLIRSKSNIGIKEDPETPRPSGRKRELARAVFL